jgi:VWFA-related protein
MKQATRIGLGHWLDRPPLLIRIVCLFLTPVLTGSMLLSSFAQGQDKPATTSTPQTFSSRSELVLVPVIATTSDGVPARGLSRDQFHIFQDGVQQRIVSFEEVSPELLTQITGNPNKSEFSNIDSELSRPRRYVILVLSSIRGTPKTVQDARDAVLAFLDRIAGRNLAVALVWSDSSSATILQDFSTDPKVLSAAVRRVRNIQNGVRDWRTGTSKNDRGASANSDFMSHLSEPKTGDDAAIDVLAGRIAQALDAAFQEQYSSFRTSQSEGHTVSTLTALARYYEGIPGRKSVIWVGAPAMPYPGYGDNYWKTEVMFEALANANMAVYPIDATMTTDMISGFHQDVTNMINVAERTGGTYIFHGYDLLKTIDRAVADSAHYYMLSYRLQRGTRKGWHKIKVAVDSPHVRIRTRSGLFVGEVPRPAEVPPDQDITDALRSVLPYTGISMTAKWLSQRHTPNAPTQIRFELLLRPGAMTLDQADNHTAVQFVIDFRDVSGRSVSRISQLVEGCPSATTVKALRTVGFVYKNSVTLAPGHYSVKFVVRDDLSGRIGSLTAPLDVE